MNIQLRNQGFRISLAESEEIPNQLLRKYHVYSYKPNPITKKRDIAQAGYSFSPIENSFYFPHGSMDTVIGGLKVLNRKFSVSDGRDTSVYRVDLKFAFDITYREDQEEYVKALTENPVGRRIVALHTGGGKTVIACKALEIIGERFLVLIKAGYIDKWISDLNDNLGLSGDDIFIFTGFESFSKYLSLTDEKRERIKCYIMSTLTLDNYLKRYDVGEDVPIDPNNMLQTIRSNVMLSDEVHQHFALIAKGILRLDPRYVIGLSATLIHKDKRKQLLYDIVFPKTSQLIYTLYKPYITAYMVSYHFRNPGTIRYERKRTGYSQNLLEEWILMSPTRKLKFFKASSKIFEEHYVNIAGDDDKALFLCNRREMAMEITQYLSNRYELDVRRNIGGDSYKDLIGGKVVVATVGKGSTAVDIKGLLTVFNLVCSDSLQFNIQAPGRLRPRKGKKLRYIQLYTPDIRQHRRYIADIKRELRWLYVDICDERIDEPI